MSYKTIQRVTNEQGTFRGNKAKQKVLFSARLYKGVQKRLTGKVPLSGTEPYVSLKD